MAVSRPEAFRKIAGTTSVTATLPSLLDAIARCRICVDTPSGRPLPHAPRPVLRVSAGARLLIAGQAPGTKVHASGTPFTDRSGDRLRDWLGLDEQTFYDRERVAIVPMGFCFPGQDAKGADLPPRPECARTWHPRVMAELPAVDLVIALGRPAQSFHMARLGLSGHLAPTLTGTVAGWRQVVAARTRPSIIPLPHPSWRNSGWLARNPWFDADLLPVLRARVAAVLAAAPSQAPAGAPHLAP